jgi:hypothetical protein
MIRRSRRVVSGEGMTDKKTKTTRGLSWTLDNFPCCCSCFYSFCCCCCSRRRGRNQSRRAVFFLSSILNICVVSQRGRDTEWESASGLWSESNRASSLCSLDGFQESANRKEGSAGGGGAKAHFLNQSLLDWSTAVVSCSFLYLRCVGIIHICRYDMGMGLYVCIMLCYAYGGGGAVMSWIFIYPCESAQTSVSPPSSSQKKQDATNASTIKCPMDELTGLELIASYVVVANHIIGYWIKDRVCLITYQWMPLASYREGKGTRRLHTIPRSDESKFNVRQK